MWCCPEKLMYITYSTGNYAMSELSARRILIDLLERRLLRNAATPSLVEVIRDDINYLYQPCIATRPARDTLAPRRSSACERRENVRVGGMRRCVSGTQ
jgi:hypothetical protein